jgi:hypothetical protein
MRRHNEVAQFLIAAGTKAIGRRFTLLFADALILISVFQRNLRL